MAKLEQAINQLRAVGARVRVSGFIFEGVDQLRELALLAGSVVQVEWTMDRRIREWFAVDIDGVLVEVQAMRAPVAADFQELAVRA